MAGKKERQGHSVSLCVDLDERPVLGLTLRVLLLFIQHGYLSAAMGSSQWEQEEGQKTPNHLHDLKVAIQGHGMRIRCHKKWLRRGIASYFLRENEEDRLAVYVQYNGSLCGSQNHITFLIAVGGLYGKKTVFDTQYGVSHTETVWWQHPRRHDMLKRTLELRSRSPCPFSHSAVNKQLHKHCPPLLSHRAHREEDYVTTLL